MAPKPTSAPPAPSRSSAPLPGPATTRVSSQHERLLLELLPFKEATKFHDWLTSNFVRGSWDEFHTDYLSRLGPVAEPEPDKNRTAQAARDAYNSRKAKFLVYHPDKTDWTAEDHHVRFIVTLVADNLLQQLWHESEWRKKGLDIAKAAYEVLIFLKATAAYADADPPVYSA
ncbi:hypothetical protein CCHL11_01238 [Colletotrichum chlorophyti]|uniref:Uncharacterized protein n=1 Tax=Colletotrichum chlorophyti TaxID=708187 RepID=A0A1Q8S7V3_9PEZI|nr:hypothetical protein CCHL11_01238 [Colletotrichum chlorophyti]